MHTLEKLGLLTLSQVPLYENRSHFPNSTLSMFSLYSTLIVFKVIVKKKKEEKLPTARKIRKGRASYESPLSHFWLCPMVNGPTFLIPSKCLLYHLASYGHRCFSFAILILSILYNSYQWQKCTQNMFPVTTLMLLIGKILKHITHILIVHFFL